MFDIDLSVCMQCQICVEVCPFDAIKMDNDYEKARYGRFTQLVEHLPDLLKPNEYYQQIKPTEAGKVDAKLKAEAEKKAKKVAAAAKPSAAAAPAPPTTAPAATVAKPVSAAGTAASTPAAPTPMKITIPDDAPFNAEQRAWLAGFLSGVSAGSAGVPPALVSGSPTATSAVVPPAAASKESPPGGAGGTPSPPSPAPAEATPAAAPSGDWPWHDAGMAMPQRMELAKDKPLADKLMAAMAQTDCHACGYDCRGYADAVASGAESDLSLCLPGEAETAAMLEKLMKEAGKV